MSEIEAKTPAPPYAQHQPSGQYAQPQYMNAPQPVFQPQMQPQMHPPQPMGGFVNQGQQGYVVQQPQPLQYAAPQMVPQMAPPQVYLTSTPLSVLNRGAAPVDCPACGQRVITRVSYRTGGTTHAWAAGLCFLFCLGFIPYLTDSLKDAVHHCSNCGVLLATWHRSGFTEVHQHR